jgi:Holliday junction DNA helicase RuvA
MILTLSGKVSEKLGEQLVLDVSGVGYGLIITSADFSSVSSTETVKFYIYEHIRENTYDLYGFLNLANIASGEVKFLQTAKGVGRRAAEQIVVELRDKVGALVTEGAEGIVNRAGVGLQDEAAEALMSLGYSAQDAAISLEKIDKDLPVEERIKQALRGN